MYTRVLLGNLSLERVVFKKKFGFSGKWKILTKGGNLDSIARQFLWHVGEEYRHGTGHGVGYFLNVHEGPCQIGGALNKPVLSHGVTVSNEPGYYLKDKFGIRIENVLLTLTDEKDNDSLCFENVTMVPYEIELLDFNLISEDFRNYINDYHQKVFDIISPQISEDKIAMEYLKRKTLKI